MSRLVVIVRSEGLVAPPIGAPVRIEARDTGLEDAPAVVVGRVAGSVTGPWPDEPAGLVRLELQVDRIPDSGTVFVHVDLDGDGRLSLGDLITMESYPIPLEPEAVVKVSVRPIGGPRDGSSGGPDGPEPSPMRSEH